MEVLGYFSKLKSLWKYKFTDFVLFLALCAFEITYLISVEATAQAAWYENIEVGKVLLCALLPCLAYTDNLIINEVEAGAMTGIEPTNENLLAIAKKLKEYGVKERVIIHKPDVGVCYSESGFTVVPSYEIPKEFIKGTTGAGDAFCAGALLGIYRGDSDEEILSFASAAAVAALSQADAVSGMRSEEQIKNLCKNFNRRNVCL